MVQVRNRLQETVKRSVPMVQLFKYPTVRSLAAALGGEDGEATGPNQVGKRGEATRDRRESLRRRRGRLVRAAGRKGSDSPRKPHG